MSINDKQVWQQYATALTNLLTTGSFDKNSETISFAGMSSPVDLGNADPQITSGTVYELGNSIPVWSPAYTPRSDLVTAYSLFLNAIDLKGDPNPNLDSQINIAADQLNKAQANYIDQQQKAVAAYSAYKTIDPNISFLDYVRGQYPVYQAAYDVMIQAQNSYTSLCTQRGGPGWQDVQQAINAISYLDGARNMELKNKFNMQIKRGTMAPAGSTSVLPGQTVPPAGTNMEQYYVPEYTLGGKFDQVYAEWQTKSAKGIVDVGPIKLSASSRAEEWNHFGWEHDVATGFSIGFFSFWGQNNTTYQSMSDKWSSSDYELSVSFTGLGAFAIQPGAWFRPALIQNYKGSLRKGSPEYFGEKGTLNLLPAQAIIGFEPQITMTLNNSQYSSFKETWQSQTTGGICIGPFYFGGGPIKTYGEKNNVTCNDASQTVSIGPIKSTLPLLLGVISTKL